MNSTGKIKRIGAIRGEILSALGNQSTLKKIAEDNFSMGDLLNNPLTAARPGYSTITITSFESNGRTIKLRKPLVVEVKHEKEGDIAENADYSIYVYAEKGEDIAEAVRTDLSVSWSRLTSKSDSELTREAIDLKHRMLKNMYEE